MTKINVLIIGGGFGGLQAAKTLSKLGISNVLVDKQNHHLFQPLLYQVATAGLSAPAIAAPLRHILKDSPHTEVVQGEITHLDLSTNTATLDHHIHYEFNACIVACGAATSYFGNPQWEQHAPGLKTIDDAHKIRSKMLYAFEKAEKTTNPAERTQALTFVIIGGGPTGVELAGSLAEIAHDTLRDEFHHIRPEDARIILMEGSPRVLAAMDEKLSTTAQQDLLALGVEVKTHCRVLNIQENQVTFKDGDAEPVNLKSDTIIWAAGVQPAELVKKTGAAHSIPSDRGGRWQVEATLQVPNMAGVFAIGDGVAVQSDGKPVPGMAPAAKQMGELAAQNVARYLTQQELKSFHYKDNGALATIGRHKAVVQLNHLKLDGYFAWLFWLFIHVFFLIGWRNRAIVLADWAWSYWTKQRWARIVSNNALNAPIKP